MVLTTPAFVASTEVLVSVVSAFLRSVATWPANGLLLFATACHSARWLAKYALLPGRSLSSTDFGTAKLAWKRQLGLGLATAEIS